MKSKYTKEDVARLLAPILAGEPSLAKQGGREWWTMDINPYAMPWPCIHALCISMTDDHVEETARMLGTLPGPEVTVATTVQPAPTLPVRLNIPDTTAHEYVVSYDGQTRVFNRKDGEDHLRCAERVQSEIDAWLGKGVVTVFPFVGTISGETKTIAFGPAIDPGTPADWSCTYCNGTGFGQLGMRCFVEGCTANK